MNWDGFTQRLRERFNGRRSDRHEEADVSQNRSSLRRMGFQGRTGMMQFKDGQMQGRPRGRFLGRGRRSAILVSNVPGWQDRQLVKIINGRGKNTRVRRTIQRMRANGKEVVA